MKIASSAIQMNSSHASLQQHDIKETLRAWVGDRHPDFEGTQRRQSPSPAPALQFPDPVQLSDAGKNFQSSEASAIEQGLTAAENDPTLRMIRAMIAMLTGHDAKVFDASEMTGNASPANTTSQATNTPAPTQPAGFGVEYDRHESYSESEQTSFQASGVVRTADGKEISFDIALSMSRSYHEESDVSIRLGDARQKQDPLVINFNGTAAQLSSQRFNFDLNSDGKAENINFATNGSGFLAFDRNGDGKINNGTELFGASSGNGFSELASLDSDRNGWIDENDAAYEKLRVWSKDAAGNDQLLTLKQADVGALNVAAISTPFDIKETNNALQGQIKSSSIYLHENGIAGTIQQVDLTV
jgi:hypothetical protein